MRVGDLLIRRDLCGVIRHGWEIIDIVIGQLNQESLVTLKSIIEDPGVDYHGHEALLTTVPLALLKCVEGVVEIRHRQHSFEPDQRDKHVRYSDEVQQQTKRIEASNTYDGCDETPL